MSQRDVVTLLYTLSAMLLVLAIVLVVLLATRLTGLPLIAVALCCLVVASETRKKMKNG